MKKNLFRTTAMSLSLICALSSGISAAGGSTTLISTQENGLLTQFSDFGSNAAYTECIQYCVKNGLLKGVADTTLAPELTTTRAMMATMLWRLDGEPIVNYAMSFKDVEADEWYTEAIRWAQSNKLVIGRSDEQFDPNDPITREQAAVFLYRYAQFKGYDVKVDETADTANYDFDGVGEYAKIPLMWAIEKSILGDTDGDIRSASMVTRAEATAMVQCFCEQVTKQERTDLLGGWQISEDLPEAELPEAAKEAFEQAMNGFTGVGYTPIAYLGSQIVAGTNYAYLCKATLVTAQPGTSLAVVIVYKDLQGNASVRSIKRIDLTECTAKTDTEFQPENFMGGWMLNTEAGALSEDAKAAFDQALNNLLGVGYTPLACIGSQIAAGKNYAILCTASTVSASPASALAIVVVNAPISGNAEILRISGFSITGN